MAFTYDKSSRVEGRRIGGTFTYTKRGSELEVEYYRPTARARLDIEPELALVEAKLMRFWRQLDGFLGTDDSNATVAKLDVPFDELSPLLEFIADHISQIRGLVDPSGEDIAPECLDREDHLAILQGLGRESLIQLATRVYGSAGLKPEAKKNSVDGSSPDTGDADVPSANKGETPTR